MAAARRASRLRYDANYLGHQSEPAHPARVGDRRQGFSQAQALLMRGELPQLPCRPLGDSAQHLVAMQHASALAIKCARAQALLLY